MIRLRPCRMSLVILVVSTRARRRPPVFKDSRDCHIEPDWVLIYRVARAIQSRGWDYRCTLRQSILTDSEGPVETHLPIVSGNETEEQTTLKVQQGNSSPRNESLSLRREEGVVVKSV